MGKVADSNSEWDWAVGGFSMLAFLVGGITSIISGYIGMKVAVFSNARTTVSAIPDGAAGWKGSFNAAFRAGAVTGFMLVGIALLVLYVLACLFSLKFNRRKFSDGQLDPMNNAKELFEALSGYGLGGSSIAMFGRVGGAWACCCSGPLACRG